MFIARGPSNGGDGGSTWGRAGKVLSSSSTRKEGFFAMTVYEPKRRTIGSIADRRPKTDMGTNSSRKKAGEKGRGAIPLIG